MYHFHFDKGTVYLPSKKHEHIPVIISCYAHDAAHWAKRVEEDTRDAAVKAGMGLVVFRSVDIDAMVRWTAAKKFSDPQRIGLLSLGVPERVYRGGNTGLAFEIVTLPGDAGGDITQAATPRLILQGTGAKITLDAVPCPEEEITRKVCDKSKSAAIRFNGSDAYLFNVSRKAADEIITWVRGVVA